MNYRTNRKNPGETKRGRPARTHDNILVREFVRGFWNVAEMQERYPRTEDVLTGTLALRTAGDTSSRNLCRSKLFHILRWADHISVREVQALLGDQYAERTCQKYAVAAAVASQALGNLIRTLPEYTAELDVAAWADAGFMDTSPCVHDMQYANAA